MLAAQELRQSDGPNASHRYGTKSKFLVETSPFEMSYILLRHKRLSGVSCDGHKVSQLSGKIDGLISKSKFSTHPLMQLLGAKKVCSCRLELSIALDLDSAQKTTVKVHQDHERFESVKCLEKTKWSVP